MAKTRTHINGQNTDPLKLTKQGPSCMANYGATPRTPTTQRTAPHNAQRRRRAVPKMHFLGALFICPLHGTNPCGAALDLSAAATSLPPGASTRDSTGADASRACGGFPRLCDSGMARALRAHVVVSVVGAAGAARVARAARARSYVPTRHGPSPLDTALPPGAGD